MAGRLGHIRNWEALAKRAKFQPETMAVMCAVSLRHLERFFARKFNTTPAKWARAIRCQLARQLIAQGWSNKAVAAELNYWDGSHLCREFRSFYGMPPQTFSSRLQDMPSDGPLR